MKIAKLGLNMQRIFMIAAVSVTTLFFIGLFLYQARAQVSAHRPNEETTGNGSSGISLPQKVPIFEVHIANNGLTLLRGVRVISISDDTIRVITEWDSADFVWKVQIKFFTKFMTSKGDKNTLADIQVGDIVTVTGTLIKGGAEPIIDAQFVRE